ncbi:MAG: hypothetical protein ACXVA9_11060 [Bdellovibrionales bacterium]
MKKNTWVCTYLAVGMILIGLPSSKATAQASQTATVDFVASCQSELFIYGNSNACTATSPGVEKVLDCAYKKIQTKCDDGFEKCEIHEPRYSLVLEGMIKSTVLVVCRVSIPVSLRQ